MSKFVRFSLRTMLVWGLALTLMTGGALSEDFTEDQLEARRIAESGGEPAIAAFDPPLTAWLDNMEGFSSLCWLPTDYDIPQSVYFNGVRVQVLDRIYKWTYNGMEEWASVTVTVRSDETAITGKTLYANLAFERPARQFPVGILQGESITNMVRVYLDNGHTKETVDILKNGTEVDVLGLMKGFYHVLTQGKRGFVAEGDLKLSRESKAAVRAATPEQYDSIGPGYEKKYSAFSEEVDRLYAFYGDRSMWPMELRAKVSQIELDSGFMDENPLTWVHIMPGEEDLTPKEARGFADTAMARAGHHAKDFSSVYTYYFAEMGNLSEPIWQFYYEAEIGGYNYAVRLDRQGAVTEIRKLDLTRFDNEGRDIYDLMLTGHEKEIPMEGDLTEDQARDIAWEYYARRTNGVAKKDNCFLSAHFRRVGRLRYWL